MSLNAYQWAWSWQRDLNQAAGKVLLALADHHNRDDPTRPCWPSLDLLATMTGLNRGTVVRAVRELEQAGPITAHHTRGGRGRTGTTHYDLHLDRPGSAVIPKHHPKQSRDATVSDSGNAKQSRDATASSRVTRQESIRESENHLAQVSPEHQPAPARHGGNDHSSPKDDGLPDRLAPVIKDTVRSVIAHDRRIGLTKTNLTTRRQLVEALVLELMAQPGSWPDWIAHGPAGPLAQALTSKAVGEPVHPSIADQLDQAVQRATGTAIAEAG